MKTCLKLYSRRKAARRIDSSTYSTLDHSDDAALPEEMPGGQRDPIAMAQFRFMDKRRQHDFMAR